MLKNYSRTLVVAAFLWVVLWLGAGVIVGLAKAQPVDPEMAPQQGSGYEPGPHERYHDFYKDWMQPGGTMSCCNANEYHDEAKLVHKRGDCEPTEAELRETGERRNGRPVFQWWARTPKYLGGDWIPIPDERVIRQVNPEPNSAHLCYNYGRVLCFVPPFGGF